MPSFFAVSSSYKNRGLPSRLTKNVARVAMMFPRNTSITLNCTSYARYKQMRNFWKNLFQTRNYSMQFRKNLIMET